MEYRCASPKAIRRYLRHGYLTWTPRPAYVLLAGDGSSDYQDELPSSGHDWIPTYLIIESILGPRGYELVAHDSYYSLNLNVANPAVRDEITQIAGFWLQQGLAGFRMDAVPFLIEPVGMPPGAIQDPHDLLADLVEASS